MGQGFHRVLGTAQEVGVRRPRQQRHVREQRGHDSDQPRNTGVGLWRREAVAVLEEQRAAVHGLQQRYGNTHTDPGHALKVAYSGMGLKPPPQISEKLNILNIY